MFNSWIQNISKYEFSQRAKASSTKSLNVS